MKRKYTSYSLLLGGLFGFLLWSCSAKTEKAIEVLTFELPQQRFGDFEMYYLLNSQNPEMALSIKGKGREAMGLTDSPKDFSLPNGDLTIEISKWDQSMEGFFGNDAIDPDQKRPQRLDVWRAVAGTVSLSVSNVEPASFPPGSSLYTMDVVLSDLLFENEKGEKKRIERLVIKDASLGWLPG